MRILTVFASLLLLGLSPAAGVKAADKAAEKAGPFDAAVQSLVGRQLLAQVTGTEAKRSVRGTSSLWTQVLVQKGANSPALETLESDLRLTEMEAPLRDEEIGILDPKAQPLSLGSKPTLVLNVYFVPKHSLGSDQDFYLVTLRAIQDVRIGALGSLKMTLTTWMKVGAPIPSAGNAGEDAAAIRRSAREAVGAFIKAVHDED
jgi:hypothetical protein